MKKVLAMILTLCFILSLVSCGPSLENETKETGEAKSTAPQTEENLVTGEHDPSGFAVGYSKVEVNPPRGTGLGGFGNTDSRLSERILDDLFVTCVAISDGEDKVLMYTVDFLGVSAKNRDQVSRLVEKALGIPEERIFITATHTHSAPQVRDGSASVAKYMSIFYQGMLKAAVDAVADLDRADLYVGSTQTTNLNYVRRYFREDGTFYGSNFYTNSTSPVARHETEADGEMQIIKFDRKNQKDVLMVNFQCHATTTSGLKKTDVSADFVGTFRDAAEKDLDVLFAYYQGAAGNLVPNSSLPTEPSNKDYDKHGQDLSDALAAALPNLKKAETGKIRVTSEDFFGYYETNIEGFDLEEAQEIKSAFETGDTDKVKELCLKYGYHSFYHARGILDRATRSEGDGTALPIAALSIGDVAFVCAPYEMFDTNGMQIKSSSPFDMTFICGYTNAAFGYIPSALGFQNGGYEVDGCSFRAGIGEELVAEFLKMLSEVKG